MRNAVFSKKMFIQAAYGILTADGIEAVSLRRVALALGCNTATLYRYFDSLDELLAYASLGTLQDYLAEVHQRTQACTNSLQQHFEIWDCFAKYAFQSPDIFNNLFFGRYSRRLDSIIQEYYTLFPAALQGMDENLARAFRSGNFNHRDYLLISRAVQDGFLKAQDAKLLNAVSINLYKGYLKGVLDGAFAEGGADAAREEFIGNLRSIILKFTIC